MGHNVTEAKQVILMNPFWNPFVESQPIDVAHRIAQENSVSVLRILVEDRVEDGVVKLQQMRKVVIEEALRSDGLYLGGIKTTN